jgi:high-affinity nickel-transport protein
MPSLSQQNEKLNIVNHDKDAGTLVMIPKRRFLLVLLFVTALNIAAWGTLYDLKTIDAAVLGIGILAYFFGLRHAFDADHIAAIDNVTRKLRQDGQRPTGVGLFFSLGHSTIVILLSLAIVIGVRKTETHLKFLEHFGNIFGTAISAGFLTLIGVVNFFIFLQLWDAFVRSRKGNKGISTQGDIQNLLEQRGFLTRIFGFAYKKIKRSWQMYFVGFLFGLGFDTASEVAILGISAVMAQNNGLPLWGVMVFPLLFTAGMSFMDTADGIAMMKIYDWAMIDGVRKLFFNTIITGLSVLIALVVGGIEWLQLLSMQLKWGGTFWNFLQKLNFGALGGIIVFLMLLTWGGAWIYYQKVLKPEQQNLL